MTYDINNLDKFDEKYNFADMFEDSRKYCDSVQSGIKEFILQDRQEAYNAGRQSGLDDLVTEIEKHEWFTEMNEDWDMIKEQINKLKQ